VGGSSVGLIALGRSNSGGRHLLSFYLIQGA